VAGHPGTALARQELKYIFSGLTSDSFIAMPMLGVTVILKIKVRNRKSITHAKKIYWFVFFKIVIKLDAYDLKGSLLALHGCKYAIIYSSTVLKLQPDLYEKIIV